MEGQIVEVPGGGGVYFSKTVVFTHGTRIPNLVSSSEIFPIKEKIHPRPAIHFIVSDKSPSVMFEAIFALDPIIKYVHDVTRFTKESAYLVGKKKLFVFALHNDVTESAEIYALIFDKLKRIGLVGENAILEGQKWWDIYLPRLDDDDLQNLKDEFWPQIEILKTENTAKAIGNLARKWESKIGPAAFSSVKD